MIELMIELPEFGHTDSQVPLVLLRTMASITFILATESRIGVGTAVSFKIAWLNRSPWIPY